MKRLFDQTLEEFKKEVFEMVKRLDMSFEDALEYVFKQAHIRGEWAGSKGIIE
ncbi:hypothetical protein [Paenibacillus sp. Cedars]|uniref:hypothetical protein n=1 Tax=Paenibacillus sp. Cedars TaxID=1980674 RepID=UPI0015624BAF|nr:hypothetical protein [Paenibacillus sp. Cedars]